MDETHPPGIDHLTFEMDFKEDIAAELEDFILLARLGIIDEALEVADHILWPHLHIFPVFAEVSGFLIQYELWDKLRDIQKELERRRITFDGPDEMAFATHLRILANQKHPSKTSTRTLDFLPNVLESKLHDIQYSCPTQLQQIELLALVAAKDFEVGNGSFISFTERHLDRLIQDKLWWEAARIFAIVCSRSQKIGGFPYKKAAVLYDRLAKAIKADRSLVMTLATQDGIEGLEHLTSELEMKSAFANLMVYLLQQQRLPNQGSGIRPLHAEIRQILLELCANLEPPTLRGHYEALWRTREDELHALQISEVLITPSSPIHERVKALAIREPGRSKAEMGVSFDMTTQGREFRQKATEAHPAFPSPEQDLPQHVPDDRLAALDTAKDHSGSATDHPKRINEPSLPKGASQGPSHSSPLRTSPENQSSVGNMPQTNATTPDPRQPSVTVMPSTESHKKQAKRDIIKDTRSGYSTTPGERTSTDEAYDGLQFKLLDHPKFQTLAGFPPEDILQRARYLREERMFSRDDWDYVEHLLNESVTFEKMGQRSASRQCLLSCVLLVMTWKQPRSKRPRYLRALLDNDSLERDNLMSEFEDACHKILALAKKRDAHQSPQSYLQIPQKTDAKGAAGHTPHHSLPAMDYRSWEAQLSFSRKIRSPADDPSTDLTGSRHASHPRPMVRVGVVAGISLLLQYTWWATIPLVLGIAIPNLLQNMEITKPAPFVVAKKDKDTNKVANFLPHTRKSWTWLARKPVRRKHCLRAVLRPWRLRRRLAFIQSLKTRSLITQRHSTLPKDQPGRARTYFLTGSLLPKPVHQISSVHNLARRLRRKSSQRKTFYLSPKI